MNRTYLPDEIRAELADAAAAAGSFRINARIGWLKQIVNRPPIPRLWEPAPGTLIGYLRCNPEPCITLWAAADDELQSDWEVVTDG